MDKVIRFWRSLREVIKHDLQCIRIQRVEQQQKMFSCPMNQTLCCFKYLKESMDKHFQTPQPKQLWCNFLWSNNYLCCSQWYLNIPQMVNNYCIGTSWWAPMFWFWREPFFCISINRGGFSQVCICSRHHYHGNHEMRCIVHYYGQCKLFWIWLNNTKNQ